MVSTVLGFARYVIDGCRAISGKGGQTMTASPLLSINEWAWAELSCGLNTGLSGRCPEHIDSEYITIERSRRTR